MMHRTLVEEKKWIDEARFLHALNYCMLLPGPEAQQLATYIGWLIHKTAGGLIAGLLFILPGALVMLGLSIIYVLYADVPLVTAAFIGIKAAVLVVVIEAVIRIGRRAITSTWMLAISIMAFIAIFFFSISFPIIIISAAFAGFIGNLLYSGSPKTVPKEITARKIKDSLIERMELDGKLAHTHPSLSRAVFITFLFLLLWFVPILLIFIFFNILDHIFFRIFFVFFNYFIGNRRVCYPNSCI